MHDKGVSYFKAVPFHLRYTNAQTLYAGVIADLDLSDENSNDEGIEQKEEKIDKVQIIRCCSKEGLIDTPDQERHEQKMDNFPHISVKYDQPWNFNIIAKAEEGHSESSKLE